MTALTLKGDLRRADRLTVIYPRTKGPFYLKGKFPKKQNMVCRPYSADPLLTLTMVPL